MLKLVTSSHNNGYLSNQLVCTLSSTGYIGVYIPFAFYEGSKTSKGGRGKMFIKRNFPGYKVRRRIVQVSNQSRCFFRFVSFTLTRFLLFVLRVILLIDPNIVAVCASSIPLRLEKRCDHVIGGEYEPV